MMDGLQLRDVRLRLELTQDEMADVLGYGAGTRISEIENDRRNVPRAVALVIEALESGWRPKDWAH